MIKIQVHARDSGNKKKKMRAEKNFPHKIKLYRTLKHKNMSSLQA
jgi:hypothetical protein